MRPLRQRLTETGTAHREFSVGGGRERCGGQCPGVSDDPGSLYVGYIADQRSAETPMALYLSREQPEPV